MRSTRRPEERWEKNEADTNDVLLRQVNEELARILDDPNDHERRCGQAGGTDSITVSKHKLIREERRADLYTGRDCVAKSFEK